MEFSKSAERKYIWNFNNGSLKRQQRKISNSFTSFHHTAYLENITNNGNRRLQSTNQALPPIPYIVPKRITVLNSFINCSNTSCKANPNNPHKNIWKKLEKENLVKRTNATREIAMENISNEFSKQESNPSQKNKDQPLRFQNISNSGSVPNFKNTSLGVIEENNSNSLGFHEKLKQNVLCGNIMKNLINQLTCAEQLFQNSLEKNKKEIESKLVIEDEDKFKSNFSVDSDRAREIINKPFISKKISNICKIFEKRESQETLPKSNYSSNSSHHDQINVNWNSKHVDLSKLSGNSESTKIKHSACLKSAIIDKIKEKVFSTSKDSINNQNYIQHNNTLKFPKETSMAMKLLLNKRMLGLNENNKNDNLEKVLHSQHKTKKKQILKSDPNLPCHNNLLCTKGNHSGRCDTRPVNATKVSKNCQASWLHSNNYYEGDLDLLNNCLNLTFQTN